jgi:hypothetical protein
VRWPGGWRGRALDAGAVEAGLRVLRAGGSRGKVGERQRASGGGCRKPGAAADLGLGWRRLGMLGLGGPIRLGFVFVFFFFEFPFSKFKNIFK